MFDELKEVKYFKEITDFKISYNVQYFKEIKRLKSLQASIYDAAFLWIYLNGLLIFAIKTPS